MNLSLSQTRGVPLPERVAHDVLQRVLAGEFAADGVLPSERVLQATYQVSRPVVREAIKILSARGIVTAVNGVGALINRNLRAPTMESLLLAFQQRAVTIADILEARLLIEPHAVMLATQHATSAQVEALYANCATMRELPHVADGNELAQVYNSTNVEFHVLVAEASANPVFAIMMDVLMGGIWRSEHHANRVFDPAAYSHTANDHLRIVDAIAARDRSAAHHAMIEHITDTQQRLRAADKLTQPIRV